MWRQRVPPSPPEKTAPSWGIFIWRTGRLRSLPGCARTALPLGCVHPSPHAAKDRRSHKVIGVQPSAPRTVGCRPKTHAFEDARAQRVRAGALAKAERARRQRERERCLPSPPNDDAPHGAFLLCANQISRYASIVASQTRK